MKTFTLPNTTILASNIALGLMRIDTLDAVEIRSLVGSARDLGINVFDHADIYGADRHDCERRFGDAIKFSPSERPKVVIQSKVGIRPGYLNLSHGHIIRTVEESLLALRHEYLDVLLLHRPDALVEPDEVAAAFDSLVKHGKVLNFGVSNHSASQIELLKKSVDQPLVINQMQLSITHSPMIASGLAANMAGLEQSVDRDNGVLDYCRLHDVTLQAWSPFQRGFFDGTFLGDWAAYGGLNELISELSTKYDVPASAIPVSWITRHPANMQVVLGTTNVLRLKDSAAGSDVLLSREDWYRLFTTAGHVLP